MSLGADLRTYLMSKSSITAIVGTRCFKNKIPETVTTYPLIVYTQVSQVVPHTLTTVAGYSQTRMQIDCYASGKDSVKADSLAAAVYNVLAGFPAAGTAQPAMGSSTVTSVVFMGSRDFYEPPEDGSDVGLFRNSMDFWFRHDAAVPSYS